MDEPNGRVARDSAPPSPPRWKGVASLGPVQRFNERCLKRLQTMALAEGAESIPILGRCRALWSGLDVDARTRLAHLPFTLMYAQFRPETWWRVAGSAPTELVVERAAPLALPTEVNEALAHELILFAWQTAGTDRTVAQLAFGMTAGVSEIIAALSSHQVLSIAMRSGTSVQLRWVDDVDWWCELLAAAAAADPKLAELQLFAKVKFCSELIHGMERTVSQ